jgi:hypothetical protein
VIRVETSEADLDQLDDLFVDYLKRIDDENEAGLADAMFVFLLELVADHSDALPKCRRCGSIICPHCGRHSRDTG